MDTKRLTDRKYWDKAWERISLPAEVCKERANPLTRELIGYYERYLPRQSGLSLLEIGGAPGQFLAFFAREYGYKVSAIDYSPVGCEKIRENFQLLGLDVTVYEQDLFADLSNMPRFDIVFSSGFVEHFEDIDTVISRHVALLSDNGLLVVGVPNFGGISQLVLSKLAPDLLSKHNIATMDASKWADFAEHFGLDTLFCGYIGGFEPRNFRRCEGRTIGNLMLRAIFKPIRFLVTDRFHFLRKFNSRYWSAYLIGIYKKK